MTVGTQEALSVENFKKQHTVGSLDTLFDVVFQKIGGDRMQMVDAATQTLAPKTIHCQSLLKASKGSTLHSPASLQPEQLLPAIYWGNHRIKRMQPHLHHPGHMSVNNLHWNVISE